MYLATRFSGSRPHLSLAAPHRDAKHRPSKAGRGADQGVERRLVTPSVTDARHIPTRLGTKMVPASPCLLQV